MCGRFVSITEPDGLVRFFTVDQRETEPLQPRYNVAPTTPVYAITAHPASPDERVLVRFQWGLVPRWAKDRKIGSKMINARAETVAEKPAYRDVLRRKRCLIPADGFYEWRARDGGPKVPYFIHHQDGTPLAFAGMWSAWRDPEVADDDDPAAWLRTCTIITTDAGPRMSALHTRMPVLLTPADWAEWLDPGQQDPQAAKALLDHATDAALEWHAVSTRVNSVRFDDPSLIEPWPAPDEAPA